LKAGYFDMVRGSIIGAILANLLLAMGIAFFLGGLRHHTQTYSAAPMRLYSSMMLIAAISLAVPSAFSRLFASEGIIPHEKSLNLATAIILLLTYVLYLVFLLKTHPDYFKSVGAGATESHAHEGPQWSVSRATGSLVVASVFVAWMSEILVGAADATGKALGMSEVFIGVVFLAVVGGAAGGFGPAAVVARKNKLDLTVGIAVGASIQIALFVAPALVLTSFFIAPQPLMLSFSRAEIGTLFLSVLIGAMVAGDGQSNWYKGVQLIIVYTMIAIMFYFLPVAEH
jgi:Ca2+:H+ antiporter